MSRHLLALALAAAVGTGPLVMDLCAGSCEAMDVVHRAHEAGTAPACHHTTSSASRIDTVPAGCGHDHDGTTLAAVTGDSGVSARPLFVAVLGVASPASAQAAPLFSFLGKATSPPPDQLAQRLGSPLRV